MRLRDYMPKSLFGRMLGIILVPMILVQGVTVFIFYERHWDSVTRQMAQSLAGEIQLIITKAGDQFNLETLPPLQEFTTEYFNFKLKFSPHALLPPPKKSTPSYAEQALRDALKARIHLPIDIDLKAENKQIRVSIQLAHGILHIFAGRKRILTSTGWTFFGWTIGSSILLFCIATIFMRAQIDPIRQLAHAARQMGLGRKSDDWQLSGAKEVRLAGRAFQAMRHRINRQMTERTAMLAGVSHDLRTPLTRMRLQMAMMPQSKETQELENNISELMRMIDGYLAFARGEAGESSVRTSLGELMQQATIPYQKNYPHKITLHKNDEPLPMLALRPQAMRRALDNLISNAVRYAEHAELRIKKRDDNLYIFIDDDGPGIEPDYRADAMKPFVRLEQSRNQTTGGTGLGLAIASDIILSHGGRLKLDDSPMGGLRVVVELPI